MLKVIFQSIPSILFEPIAVVALLGVIMAAVERWKKRDFFYCFFAGTLFFMLSWRIMIRILSSRYASIFIFPASIAVAYFCINSDKILLRFFPKISSQHRFFAAAGLTIILTVASFAQMLHYNPYASHAAEASHFIATDAVQFSNPQVLTSDPERLAYYSKLPTIKLFPKYKNENDFQTAITENLAAAKSADVVYIVIFESANTQPGYHFKKLPKKTREKIVFLKEFYHNSKKRRLTRVYRYEIRKQ